MEREIKLEKQDDGTIRKETTIKENMTTDMLIRNISELENRKTYLIQDSLRIKNEYDAICKEQATLKEMLDSKSGIFVITPEKEQEV